MAESPVDDRLPMNSLLGGRYRLESRVGSGGMGVVYRATDETLGRTVAVKIFRDSEAADLDRKVLETKLLAALNHPSLVTLYDARIDGDGDAYLVMEYVDGPTLRTRIAEGPISSVDAARMARDLGEALHVVHGAGVVHRDIKPANVLLRRSLSPGEEFTATLADFGIAHLVGSSRLTTPGTLLGTAAYLSPEQVRGSEPAPASDIYSLGLVLVEALTGERAYGQSGMHEAALARLSQDPEIPGSLGYRWKSLLTAMTARDPHDRPTAMQVVSAANALRSEGADATEPTASSATTEATTEAPTEAMPVATQKTVVMPTSAPSVAAVAGDDTAAATRLMTASGMPTVELGTATTTSSAPRRSRRWALVLGGLAGVAVIGAVLAWTLVVVPGSSSIPATTPATTQVVTGPGGESTSGDNAPADETVSVTDPVEQEPAETTTVQPAPTATEPGVTSEPADPPAPEENGPDPVDNGKGDTGGDGRGPGGDGPGNPGNGRGPARNSP